MSASERCRLSIAIEAYEALCLDPTINETDLRLAWNLLASLAAEIRGAP